MSNCRVCEAETDGFLCLRCFRQLERATAEMPSLIGDLTAVITRRTKVYRSPGRVEVREPTYDPEADVPAWLRTSEGRIALRPTALPVNLDATELLWVSLNTLGSWARIIAEHHGIGGPTSENLLVWLTANIEAVRWQDDAAEAHDEITSLHSDLVRAVDRAPDDRFLGYCDATQVTFVEQDGALLPQAATCGVPLYGRIGQEQASCSACGARYNATERLEQVWSCELNEQTARPHVIANALTSQEEPLSPTLLRKWIQRDAAAEEREPTTEGPACESCQHRSCRAIREQWRRPPRILAQGQDEEGKPLYRVGAVRARLAFVTAQRGIKLSA